MIDLSDKIKIHKLIFADSETTTLQFDKLEMTQVCLDNESKLEYCRKTGFDNITPKMFVEKDDYYYLTFSYVWYIIECYPDGTTNTFYFRKRESVANYLNSQEQNCIVYFHNMPYDIKFLNYNQCISVDMTCESILAYSCARPLSITLYNKNKAYIEIRDSAKLFAFSVKQIGDIIGVPKLEYDYDEIRFIFTPLQSEEIKYGIRDVEIIMLYWFKKLNKDRKWKPFDLKTIPLTATSEVRNTIRSIGKDYPKYFSSLQYRCKEINEDLEKNESHFMACKQAYYGGLTFSNPIRTGKILENVHSMDLTSSYPTSMVYGTYPNSKMEDVEAVDYHKYVEYIENISFKEIVRKGFHILNVPINKEKYGFIAKIKFKNLHIKSDKNGNVFPCVLTRKIINCHDVEKMLEVMNVDEYLSCFGHIEGENNILLNNKVYYAENVEMWTTNIDLFIIMQSYRYESIEAVEMYRFKMSRIHFWYNLVDELANIKSFHKLMLKDVDDGKLDLSDNKAIQNYLNKYGADTDTNKELLMHTEPELRYNILNNIIYTKIDKGNLNGLYGINVQSPIHAKYFISESGTLDKHDKLKEFSTQNFSSYLLGLYVTSYARLQLFNGFYAICNLNGKHVYSDTDSLKFLGDGHEITSLATRINNAVFKAVDYQIGFDDGLHIKYGLSNYDYEGKYKSFYTLGSKFYITELEKPDDNGFTIHGTVSGVSNINKLLNYNKDSFKDTIELFCKPYTIFDKELMRYTHQLQKFQSVTGQVLLYADRTICKNKEFYQELNLFTSYTPRKLIFKDGKIKVMEHFTFDPKKYKSKNVVF